MDMRERDKVRWTTSERAVKRSEAERRRERSSARATAAKRWTKPHGAFTHTIIILFISEVFICLPYVSPSESESNQKISVNDTDSFSELVWSDFGGFHNKSLHNFEIQLRDFWTTTDQIMVVEIKWSFFTFHFSPTNRVPRPERSCQLQMLPSSTTIKLKGGLVIFQTTYRQMRLEILARPSVCIGSVCKSFT